MEKEHFKRIRRLDPTTVNRIAAGEVIQRPSNAIKELLENSIDACSSQITVICKDGGLKLLQITDNGNGIHKQDFSIVCERFTTSKISKFEDLYTVGTFGFRGEALSSISHVSHLSIKSRCRMDSEECGWTAAYVDGKMKDSIKPCAGNHGTQITVEDLFYNVPARKKALRNTNEEYHRILDVMQRYSIHYPHISFVCKKQGSNSSDLSTQSQSNSRANIGLIYGHSISKQLIHVKDNLESLDCNFEAFVSQSDFHTKKFHFLLFINHRLVEHPIMKRSIEALYASFLPKGAHPFIYLALQVKSENLDVNVHPTKQQVHFLNEDKVVACICESIQKSLAEQNSSKTFYTLVKVIVNTDSRH